MAVEKLEVTDAQLTKLYICDTDADLSTGAKVAAVIKNSTNNVKRIAFLEDLGEFTKTRQTNEYQCIDEDVSAVSQGPVSYSETEIKLFYKAGQENGVKELENMFNKKLRKQFIIVCSDDPDGDTETKHATYITGEFINVKTGMSIQKGDVVRVPATIKITRLDNILEAGAA